MTVGMPYKALHVANSILERAFKESRQDISPLKLQKLIYFLNGWHLAVIGMPAVDEPFQAWQHGPVIPSIYQCFKKFGSGGISSYGKEYDPVSNDFKSYVVNHNNIRFYEILDAVWERYVGYSALTLSTMTHEQNSPWEIAYRGGVDEIPNSSIQQYFVNTIPQEHVR